MSGDDEVSTDVSKKIDFENIARLLYFVVVVVFQAYAHV